MCALVCFRVCVKLYRAAGANAAATAAVSASRVFLYQRACEPPPVLFTYFKCERAERRFFKHAHAARSVWAFPFDMIDRKTIDIRDRAASSSSFTVKGDLNRLMQTRF